MSKFIISNKSNPYPVNVIIPLDPLGYLPTINSFNQQFTSPWEVFPYMTISRNIATEDQLTAYKNYVILNYSKF